ncbi:hypothetical protein TNCV_2522751 [Trichonephila clavipes]|nr:hypothetical protein TNCV_2522751 [Trichonephila clavipes]
MKSDNNLAFTSSGISFRATNSKCCPLIGLRVCLIDLPTNPPIKLKTAGRTSGRNPPTCLFVVNSLRLREMGTLLSASNRITLL